MTGARQVYVSGEGGVQTGLRVLGPFEFPKPSQGL